MNVCDHRQTDSWLDEHRWDEGKCMKTKGWMAMQVAGWLAGWLDDWMGIYGDAEKCKRMEG